MNSTTPFDERDRDLAWVLADPQRDRIAGLRHSLFAPRITSM